MIANSTIKYRTNIKTEQFSPRYGIISTAWLEIEYIPQNTTLAAAKSVRQS